MRELSEPTIKSVISQLTLSEETFLIGNDNEEEKEKKKKSNKRTVQILYIQYHKNPEMIGPEDNFKNVMVHKKSI